MSEQNRPLIRAGIVLLGFRTDRSSPAFSVLHELNLAFSASGPVRNRRKSNSAPVANSELSFTIAYQFAVVRARLSTQAESWARSSRCGDSSCTCCRWYYNVGTDGWDIRR